MLPLTVALWHPHWRRHAQTRSTPHQAAVIGQKRGAATRTGEMVGIFEVKPGLGQSHRLAEANNVFDFDAWQGGKLKQRT